VSVAITLCAPFTSVVIWTARSTPYRDGIKEETIHVFTRRNTFVINFLVAGNTIARGPNGDGVRRFRPHD
jgi:hypothetical protein